MARKTKADITETPEAAATEPKTGENNTISAKDVIDRYTAGVKPLRAQHFNYWLNDAYVLGDQWLFHDRTADRIDSIPSDDDRVQVTVNHMWPASRTIIAKAVQRTLQFYVPPTGADDSTLKGARTAESILLNVHREHDWEGLREDAHWAAWKGGTCAIRIVWDPQAGTPLGMDEGNGQHFGTGDTKEDVLNITDFVVEPGARDAEHARWWIVCVGLPPKQVQQMFSLPNEPAADGAAASTPFARAVGGLQDGPSDKSTAVIPLTRVYTLYQRPTPDVPKGRVVSVVDDVIVDEKPWPFPFKDRLNMVTIRETRREGTWIGETALKSARPIQNAINAAWSAIIEHMKLCGNARLMVPESMIDTLNELTDLAGEVIPFPDALGGAAMGYVTPPVMPNWWVDAPAKFKDEMDDLLGVHEVSRGDAPGRVESGLAISILVEQDSTPVGRFVKETAGAFGRLATMALMLYEANVTETRTAIVKTPGQPPRKYGWTGKELRGQTQAEVPLDSITPRNKAADEARASTLVQMGMIHSADEYYKVAGIPLEKDVLEALSPDVARARRENADMALGEIRIPEDFDDHVGHIAEHHVMMKSAEWELMDDKTREIFRKHNKAHEILAAEAMGRQVAKGAVNPALMASVSAQGDPLLPMQSLPAPPGGPQPQPAPPPLPGNPNVAGQVALANPGVDPSIIQNELGPIQGIGA